jgi:hypothetical protein
MSGEPDLSGLEGLFDSVPDVLDLILEEGLRRFRVAGQEWKGIRFPCGQFADVEAPVSAAIVLVGGEGVGHHTSLDFVVTVGVVDGPAVVLQEGFGRDEFRMGVGHGS